MSQRKSWDLLDIEYRMVLAFHIEMSFWEYFEKKNSVAPE
jgi:hypothetical protein